MLLGNSDSRRHHYYPLEEADVYLSFVLLASGLFHGSWFSLQPESPLQKHVHLEAQRRSSPLYGLQILKESAVPGGLEIISDECSPSFEEKSYPPIDTTLDEALKVANKSEGPYSWQEQANQLLITKNAHGPSLLDVV